MKKVKDEWEEFLKQREKEKIQEEKDLQKLLQHNDNDYEETKSYYELYPSNDKDKKEETVSSNIDQDVNNDADVDDEDEIDEDDDIEIDEEDDFEDDEEYDLDDDDLDDDEKFDNKIEKIINDLNTKRNELNKIYNNTIKDIKNDRNSKPKSKAPAIIIFVILGVFMLTLMVGISIQFVPCIIIGFLGFFLTIVLCAIISNAIQKKQLTNTSSLSRAYGTIVSCELFNEDDGEKVYKILIMVGKTVYSIHSNNYYEKNTQVPVFINYKEGLCDIAD